MKSQSGGKVQKIKASEGIASQRMKVQMEFTGMSLVSSIRAGICRAERATLIAPRIFPTSS